MNKKEEKQHIRERLLERRNTIPENEFLKKSDQICTLLKQLPEFKNAEWVHCYVSMNKRREVNTHALIKEMLDIGKNVVVPVTQMQTGMLRHLQINSFADLEVNSWGVLEPREGRGVAVDSLDLVIVPMVGGDRQRNRIGYGEGFYDRFLKDVTCPKVGLLFERCLLENIPVEPFDVSLSLCITENQTI